MAKKVTALIQRTQTQKVEIAASEGDTLDALRKLALSCIAEKNWTDSIARVSQIMVVTDD